MADETYLVMANGTPDAATKVVEVREDKGERIIFRSPKYFAEGYPWHAGMGVYAKTKELAYEEQEMGRHKPGFAVVPKLVLEDLVRGARNVKLVGKVSFLNSTYRPTPASLAELEEPEPEVPEVSLPPAEPPESEKYTCEFCGGKGRKGFSKEGYIAHLQGFHLKGLRHKGQGEITDEDRATWDKINAILEELGEYAR
ncbi:MAG: hypothetical protein WC977_09540 [Anaerovoracaceae bacterium]